MLQKNTVLLLVFSAIYMLIGSASTALANTTSQLVDTVKNPINTHILTLDYISRKTNNSKYFLNLADNYCDVLIESKKTRYGLRHSKTKLTLLLQHVKKI